MRIHQIRSSDGTGTLSYIVADDTGVAAVIDPNIEDVPAIREQLRAIRATVAVIIDTHTHADHVSGADVLRESTGAPLWMHTMTREKWKVVDEGDRFGIGEILRANARIDVDRFVDDGDLIKAGTLEFRVLYTPGHTDNHIALLAQDTLFTGDLLLIGQAGRSDLPGGDARSQYASLQKVLQLPDTTRIFPGHDYANNESSTLSVEKRSNPFLQVKSEEEYLTFVRDFFPPLAESAANGKATLQCGTHRVTPGAMLFRSLTPEELAAMLHEERSPFILDVREEYELAMMGSIPGAVNIPMAHLPDRLQTLPDGKTPVVVVCQTGSRSYEAAHYLSTHGFTEVYDLSGGTLGWILSGKPVERAGA